jgi:hypothetical protein
MKLLGTFLFIHCIVKVAGWAEQWETVAAEKNSAVDRSAGI